jgi:hypothetical protein
MVVNTSTVRPNKMHPLYSVYYELTPSTCFKHYLLIFWRHCIINNWVILCVLCSTPTLVAAGQRNTPTVVYTEPPEGEQVVLETYRGC